MATHDYVIDNQSAPSLRSDLNNVLQAIVTQNSSATAPATTYANMIWYDTANNQLKKRNEANSAWLVLGTIDEGLGTFTPSGQPIIASQAEAEAGTENTKMMTALRSAQAIAALGGISGINIQVFTTSGTYTPTAGYRQALVFCTGGGQRGSTAGGTASAPGGAGGATAIAFVNISNGTPRTVTIGAAGAAAGAAGGASSVSGVCSASGGGVAYSFTGSLGIQGGAAQGTGGALPGGMGGGSFWGSGGPAASGTAGGPGGTGTAYGAGGGGACNGGTAGLAAAGVVMIVEFR